MPAKTESLRGFLKGLITVTNRFSTPKGANILMSNLIMNERGALQTCDGTMQTSHLPGGVTDPIVALSVFVNQDQTTYPQLVGLSDNGTTYTLYNFTTNPATLLISGIPHDAGWTNPQMFNFAGNLVLTLGVNTVAQLYTQPSGTPTLNQLTATNSWLPHHQYQIGELVLATTGPGAGTSFQVINPAGVAPGGVGGIVTPSPSLISGSVQPNWPAPGGATGHSFIQDNSIIWETYDTAAISGGGASAVVLPGGSAHGISHEGFLWLFGTALIDNASNGVDGPDALRQSHLNDVFGWPAIYSYFVAKDNGEPATGIGSFTIAEAGIAPQGGLVLFKEFSTYNVSFNFSNPQFSVTPVKTDMGCIAPRSVQFVPGYGLMRLSHMGVSLYDGTKDQIISEEIRPYIFGGFGVVGLNQANCWRARAALVANPPMYVLAIPTGNSAWCNRLLCYDLILGVWTVVDLPFQISSIFQARIPTFVDPVTPRPNFQMPITYLGGATDGIVRKWQTGDGTIPATWDTGGAVAWSLTTPEIGADASARAYFNRVTVRGHAPAAQKVTFTPYYSSSQGRSQTKTLAKTHPVSFGPSSGANQGQSPNATYEGDTDYFVRFDQGVTGQTERVALSGSGRVTIEAVELEITPKATTPLGHPV